MDETPKKFTTRRFGSVLAALVFIVAAVSGVMSFFATYTQRLAGVHTIAGFAFVAAAILHIAHNARTLVRYLPAQGRRVPSRALLVSLAIAASVLVSALVPLRPVKAMLAWGKAVRERGAPPRAKYDTLTLDVKAPGALLSIDVKAGPHFSFREPEHNWLMTPQMVVWIEDEDGHYLETMYASRDEAKDEYSDGDDKTTTRPAALPVWRHKVGVLPGALTLSRHTPLPDAVSGASPEDNTYLVARAHTPRTRFVVMLEVNNAFDYNDYYSRTAFSDDAVYHDSGNPAQPSVVYRAVVDTRAKSRFTLMEPIGHGHHSGADGNIDPDMSKLTTALGILDRIVVEVREP